MVFSSPIFCLGCSHLRKVRDMEMNIRSNDALFHKCVQVRKIKARIIGS
jgi:hypothetical protein